MDRKDDNQSPQGETARILVEFLEVAITSIVFLKGIYPPGAFERRKYMNLLVHRARHPELRDYIHSAVSGLLPFFKKGLVERVAVIFFDSDNNPAERFMFKLTVDHSYGSKVKEPDLEFSLRSFFVKLPVTESVTRFFPQIAGGRLRRTFGPYLGQVQVRMKDCGFQQTQTSLCSVISRTSKFIRTKALKGDYNCSNDAHKIPCNNCNSHNFRLSIRRFPIPFKE